MTDPEALVVVNDDSGVAFRNCRAFPIASQGHQVTLATWTRAVRGGLTHHVASSTADLGLRWISYNQHVIVPCQRTAGPGLRRAARRPAATRPARSLRPRVRRPREQSAYEGDPRGGLALQQLLESGGRPVVDTYVVTAPDNRVDAAAAQAAITANRHELAPDRPTASRRRRRAGLERLSAAVRLVWRGILAELGQWAISTALPFRRNSAGGRLSLGAVRSLVVLVEHAGGPRSGHGLAADL